MVETLRKKSLLFRLKAAEINFKVSFAAAGALAINKESLPLWYPDLFSFGNHVATLSELALNHDDIKLAPGILQHVSTYLCVVQIDTVLQNIFSNRFEHPDAEIRSACWIARIIRNSFAHDPFTPTWLIDRKCRDEKLIVNNIIEIKPRELRGRPVKRMDYGGPISILRFLEWTTQLIERQIADLEESASNC